MYKCTAESFSNSSTMYLWYLWYSQQDVLLPAATDVSLIQGLDLSEMDSGTDLILLHQMHSVLITVTDYMSMENSRTTILSMNVLIHVFWTCPRLFSPAFKVLILIVNIARAAVFMMLAHWTLATQPGFTGQALLNEGKDQLHRQVIRVNFIVAV